jgi:hypothetical protein
MKKMTRRQRLAHERLIAAGYNSSGLTEEDRALLSDPAFPWDAEESTEKLSERTSIPIARIVTVRRQYQRQGEDQNP